MLRAIGSAMVPVLASVMLTCPSLEATAQESIETDASDSNVVWVAFIVGENASLVVEIAPDDPVTLGRKADRDIVFAEQTVSRVHAELLYDGETLWIEDQESTNGTVVNGEYADEKTALADQDKVAIGTSVFVVSYSEPGCVVIPNEATCRAVVAEVCTTVIKVDIERVGAEYPGDEACISELLLIQERCGAETMACIAAIANVDEYGDCLAQCVETSSQGSAQLIEDACDAVRLGMERAGQEYPGDETCEAMMLEVEMKCGTESLECISNISTQEELALCVESCVP